MPTNDKVIHLFNLARNGDKVAENELYEEVQSDLQKLAANRKRGFPNQDCTTLGLVHEAWERFLYTGKEIKELEDRKTFFGCISRKILDLLIEKSRKKTLPIVPFPDEALEDQARSPTRCWEFLEDLKHKLNEFREFAPDDALIFEMRYNLHASFEEIARELDKKLSSVRYAFYRARSWLQRNLGDYRHDPRNDPRIVEQSDSRSRKTGDNGSGPEEGLLGQAPR